MGGNLQNLNHLSKVSKGVWYCLVCTTPNSISDNICVSCEAINPNVSTTSSAPVIPTSLGIGDNNVFTFNLSPTRIFKFGLQSNTNVSTNNTNSETFNFGSSQQPQNSFTLVGKNSNLFSFSNTASLLPQPPLIFSSNSTNSTLFNNFNNNSNSNSPFTSQINALTNNNNEVMGLNPTPTSSTSLSSNQNNGFSSFPSSTTTNKNNFFSSSNLTTATFTTTASTSTFQQNSTFNFKNIITSTSISIPTTTTSSDSFPQFFTSQNNSKTISTTTTTITGTSIFNSHIFSFGCNNSVSDFIPTFNNNDSRNYINNKETENHNFENGNADEQQQGSDVDYFKLPEVKLPENFEQVTGEENESIIFEKKSKLFTFKDGEYKERGVGMLKILQHNATKKCRVLMRRDHIFKVCLNSYLKDMTNVEIVNKFVRFTCIDFSEEQKPSSGIFLLKFGNPDTLVEFKDLVASANKSNSNNNNNKSDNQRKSITNNASNPNKSIGDNSDDDIQLVYTRNPRPEHLKLITELKLPVNFYDFIDNNSQCKGCIGCRVEELNWKDLTTVKQLQNKASAKGTEENFEFYNSNKIKLNIGDIERIDLLKNKNQGTTIKTFTSFINLSNFFYI